MSKAIWSSYFALSLTLFTGYSGDLWAQSYPTRAIQIIVPTAPGGGVDFLARLTGTRLAESLGRPVVTVNRPGAGNVIGTQLAARAEPDGHTLVLANPTSHGVNQAFYLKLPYDTVKDFTPITLIAAAPHLLLTSNSVSAKSVKEFIQLAKATLGQLNLGSGGTGAQSHLSGELFKLVTGIKMVHIPYNGVGPAFAAILSGDIQILFAPTTGALPHVQSGRIKALGISGVKRSQLVPDLPTLNEQGVTGFDTNPWYALLGPRGLPRPIVTRLNREVVTFVHTADFKQKLSAVDAEPIGSSPEVCAETIKEEVAKWIKLAKEIGTIAK